MAELTVDVLKLIYKGFHKIKEVMKTLAQNNEDVRNIEELVDSWSQILSPLETKPGMLEDRGISLAVKRLRESLEHAPMILTETDSIFNAQDKANKLRRLQEELDRRIATVICAMVLYDRLYPATESREPPSRPQASSSLPVSLIGMESMEASEAPFQLHRITINSTRYLRYNENSNKSFDVYPLELRFPFEPNKKIQCPVTLTNRTGHYVAVWITEICQTQEQFTCPISNTMDPYSTLAMSLTMKEHEQRPERYTGKFEVLMVVVWLKAHLENLISIIDGKLNMDKQGVTPQLEHVLEQAEKLYAEVYQAMLTAVICDPASCPIISISTSTEGTAITSIDVHPTKPWILTSHEGGKISIWNYQTQECVTTYQVTEDREIGASVIQKYLKRSYGFPHWVYSAKLIARKCFLAAGDGSGQVHVFNLTNGTTVKRVKKFSAYSGKPVDTLAVHPSKPYLLSSSTFHGKIKLWDWDREWMKIREFDVNLGGVRSITFHPRDSNTFACVTIDRKAKVIDLAAGVVDSEESTNLQVWSICGQFSSPTTTLRGLYNADFLFTHSHQQCFLVTSGSRKQCIGESAPSRTEIWDFQKKEIVHTLRVSGDRKTRGVACHPTLPILVTTLDDGTVCLWDARTYRLEKMHQIIYSRSKKGLVFTAGTNDNSRTRLVVGFESMITIMAVKICQCEESTSGLVVGAIREMP